MDTAKPVQTSHRGKSLLQIKRLANPVAYGILYSFLIVVAAFEHYPIVWLFLFSLKNNQEIFNTSPFSLPTQPKWENYVKVWIEGNIGQYFFNSVLSTSSAVVIDCPVGQHGDICDRTDEMESQPAGFGIVHDWPDAPVHSTLIPYSIHSPKPT